MGEGPRRWRNWLFLLSKWPQHKSPCITLSSIKEELWLPGPLKGSTCNFPPIKGSFVRLSRWKLTGVRHTRFGPSPRRIQQPACEAPRLAGSGGSPSPLTGGRWPPRLQLQTGEVGAGSFRRHLPTSLSADPSGRPEGLEVEAASPGTQALSSEPPLGNLPGQGRLPRHNWIGLGGGEVPWTLRASVLSRDLGAGSEQPSRCSSLRGRWAGHAQ